MGPNQDERNGRYACQNCGVPYATKPRFCYDCGYRTIVPAAVLLNESDDSESNDSLA
jgi:rRNA maturation endonuclease Nob1